jgi:lipopolysaccharide export system protein LptA
MARWGKRGVLTALILGLLLPWLAVFASESQEGVRVRAQQAGSYDWESQVFVAQGEVEITHGDLLLTGNLLTMDLSTGEVRLEGDVRMVQEDQELEGDLLIYDLETKKGRMDQASAEVLLSSGTGSIFLSGESVGLADGAYSVRSAKVTTCDDLDSHYHLATKELEYYPGDRVIIRGVTYYEGKIPLFYWPYLVVPLDRDGTSVFNLPVFGYSEQEGYYMKNSFNYHLSSKAHGHLYLDLYTRLGLGLGARHMYDLGRFGQGSVYLYAVPTSESPVLKSAFSHQWTKEHWDFKTTTSYENWWAKHELKSDNRLKLTLPSTNAEASFVYKKNPEATISEQRDMGIRWSQNLTERWRLNLQGSRIDQVRGEDSLRLISYLAETTYRQDRHTLTLAAQQQYNPDLLEGETPAWRTVQRLPEFKWVVSNWGLNSLPLGTEVILGHYGERPSTVTMNRAFGQLTLGRRSWRPAERTTVDYQGLLGGALYGDGQRQAWTFARLGLNQRLTDRLQFSSTYSRRDVWGHSPFRFDAQRPQEDLGLRLSYSAPALRASLNTNYNFLTERFSVLTLSTSWRPNSAWNLSLSAAFDLNSMELTRVVPMVEYKKDQFDLRLAVRYHPTDQVLERLDARFTLPVGTTWLVSYDSIYEPLKQAFSKGSVSITKDLHCRELRLSYDHVGKSVALQYTIKAFPTLPIGWDSQGGLSLFDLEDVADLVGVEE